MVFRPRQYVVRLGVSMRSKGREDPPDPSRRHQVALALFQLKGRFYGKEELPTIPGFILLIKASVKARSPRDHLAEHSDKSNIPSKSAESDT